MTWLPFISFSLIFCGLVNFTKGVGILLEPPARSVLAGNPQTGLNCGGRSTQYSLNGGRCGVCGDPDNAAQVNMAGGALAPGVVSQNFTNNGEMKVVVNFDSTKKGVFEFRICPHNNFNVPVKQSCLDATLLKIKNDGTQYMVNVASTATITLLLPPTLTCTQCVLQWTWITGNPGDPQPEMFRNCADIGISPGTTTPTTPTTPTSTTPTTPTTTTTVTTPSTRPTTTTVRTIPPTPTTRPTPTTTPWWWWTTHRPYTTAPPWTYPTYPTNPPTYAPPRPAGSFCFRYMMMCDQMMERPFLTMMCFQECGGFYCACGFAS